MNSDQLILRETDNLPLINKDDTLTNADLDGNFIKIYNDLLSLCSAEDSTLIYDDVKSYLIGEYATYNGKLWLCAEDCTGVTPSNLGTEWIDAFPTILAHQKNKDTILDEGGVNETTVAEIRAFIDAGLTSTTNLSLTTKTATSFKIESSTGTDVILPQATVRDAGLLSADDKVKLENTEGINTGDQTLISLNAEDVDNKAIDFTTINDTLYPTTQAVDTYLTAQVPILVETFIDSGVEVTTNKAIDFTTVNDTLYPSVKAVDDQLDLKVTSNTAITGATKTKISYDAKGLILSGSDATTADIADSTNKRYVTDANLTVIGNTSGTNTGDQDLSTYQPYTTATTGSVISFIVPQVYNSVTSPSSSNITDSLTSAKIGIVQKIYHNHTVAPTFPAGWVKMGTATYTTSILNVIFAEWVSSTRVEYWITKPS